MAAGLNAYEQIVVGNRPELFMKSAVYRQFIKNSDMMAYDSRFWLNLATQRSFDL